MWAGAAFFTVLLVFTNGCKNEPTDVLGYAYIAPATTNLRPALADRSNSVALLKYGDRVQILEVRRRFARIRTGKGAEGWIDATQLLTPAQMEKVRRSEATALKMPSEGSATVFEALNIHLEPNRQSAAFAKIPDSGSVEVLAHQLEPKVNGPPSVPVFNFPPNADAEERKKRKERKNKASYHLPTRPPPPAVPENWLNLSDGRVTVPPIVAPKKTAPAILPAEQNKPVLLEDWTLVRTRDKQCGWVLSRNLIMSIPDEVAQYAEGKRISAYFDLGIVRDEEKGPHHNWLWTTSSGPRPFDFDGWRLFIWNRRKHRYETSYRERDVVGYFPVQIDPPDTSSPVRTFELILREAGGAQLVQNRYVFDGERVHLTSREPYDRDPGTGAASAPATGTAPRRGQNWLQKNWSDFRKRFGGAN